MANLCAKALQSDAFPGDCWNKTMRLQFTT